MSETDSQSCTVTVQNRLGLHMRAAKVLMDAIKELTADVTLSNGERSANARSILSLVTLEATAGTQIEIVASGPHAAEALTVIQKLFDERFGESD